MKGGCGGHARAWSSAAGQGSRTAMRLPTVLKELLCLPTAPFLEHGVLAYLEKACGKLEGVELRRDACGNLLAHYRRAPARPPLAFVAHTDHPGFVALEMVERRML